jgi:hypothetical protein
MRAMQTSQIFQVPRTGEDMSLKFATVNPAPEKMPGRPPITIGDLIPQKIES